MAAHARSQLHDLSDARGVASDLGHPNPTARQVDRLGGPMKSRGDSLSMTLGTILRSVVEGRVRKHGLTAPREATSRGRDRGLDLTRG